MTHREPTRYNANVIGRNCGWVFEVPKNRYDFSNDTQVF